MERYIENMFIDTIEELTDYCFYVPTDEHSSGFNEVKFEMTDLYFKDEESGKDEFIYRVYEENGKVEEITFYEITNKYPKFILDKRFAFDGKFETWDRLKKAFDGELDIVLLEI
ncbi:MAG: hypothetical protein RR620_13175 [Clostridium sp.]